MPLTLPLILWIIAFATLFFVVILGAVLSYHWLRFAMNPVAASAAIGVYAVVSGVLLVVLFGACVAYPFFT